MKKLSFVLALILACGMLASCGGNSDATSSTPKGSSSTPTSSNTPSSSGTVTSSTPISSSDPVTTTSTPVVGPSTPSKPKDDLIDGARFTVDGDLSDWEGLTSMSVIGEAFTEGKKAIFYGATTTTGLYLACDAYHDIYTSTDETWWKNSNFEIFVDNSTEQVFAYAGGIGADCKIGAGDNASCKITQASMVTTEINGETKYHTITEVFISNEDLPEDVLFENTISIGMAWKTVSDLIIGGQYHVNADGSDEYWAVKGDDDTHNGEHAAPRCAMVATPKGLYWFEDYMD